MDSFAIPLRFSSFAASGGVTPSLTYEVKPLEDVGDRGPRQIQARFNSAHVACPLLDLSKFTCGAVVDCITFRANLGRNTTGGYINRVINKEVSHSSYVEIIPASGGIPASSPSLGRSFQLWIQDPTAPIIEKIVVVLRKKFGMIDDPVLSSLEVAVDWYSNDASDELRFKMTAALARHHFDPDFSVQDPLADMRQVFSHLSAPDGISTQYVLPSRAGQNRLTSDTASGERATWARVLRDRDPFNFYLDATVYRGSRDGSLLWRIQNKTADRRDPQKGTVAHLSQKERRARIEVRLQGDALRRVNINTVQDLYSFNFVKLSRKFHCCLVTAKPPLLEFSVFREGGVYGHVLRSRAARSKLRHDFSSDPEADHWRGSRVGSGKTGNLKAWCAMNKRHENALRKLSKRWRLTQP